MSNNAAAIEGGGEIGRAQALQALACRVAPTVHMNPVLLKPQSETGSQVVVQGKVVGQARAREYQKMKPSLMQAVLDSYRRLRAEADLVIVEGAGSASEINLRQNDIANMGFAQAAQLPVFLLGDIDRGGIFAQIVGTKAVLDPGDAARVAGFIVNRFRGDPALFATGLVTLEERTGWPALGLIPHFAAASDLPAEDSVALARVTGEERRDGSLTIVVPVLPHISNFDDLDPLRLEAGVNVVMVRGAQPLPPADIIILPGSKATLADLAALRQRGWDIDIQAHARRGGRVLGLCGGYQMLGHSVADPQGIEGPPGVAAGLGLLDINTVLSGSKRLRPVEGTTVRDNTPFTGFEMHVGLTTGPDCARPMLIFADGSPDGATAADKPVSGCYVHGLFAGDAQRTAFLRSLGIASSSLNYAARIETVLDALADHLAAHVDCDRLLTLSRAQP